MGVLHVLYFKGYMHVCDKLLQCLIVSYQYVIFYCLYDKKEYTWHSCLYCAFGVYIVMLN